MGDFDYSLTSSIDWNHGFSEDRHRWNLRLRTTIKPLTQLVQQREKNNTLKFIFLVSSDSDSLAQLIDEVGGFRCLTGHSLGLLRLRGGHRVDALPQAVGLSDLK